jgi:predicted AAA+ superfamily ATPase
LLRVLADRDPPPARFLLLGSSSPSLVRGASETLAGRVGFVFLDGFGLDEVSAEAMDDLWVRGGFPRSFLAQDDAASLRWRRDFVSTFVERDLPQLATGVAGTTMRRFWTMLAHNHGQVLNLSLLGRAMGVSDTTVRAYVDRLAGTFAVSLLQPWHENVGKRQVKTPKVYLSDTGVLHALLGLQSREEIEGHPILGMSWEWFAHRQVIAALGARAEECAFWATHAGAELDLLVVRGNRRLGFEFKRTDSPRRTRSMHVARSTLGLDGLYVVHPGEHSFPLGEGIHALSIRRVFDESFLPG